MKERADLAKTRQNRMPPKWMIGEYEVSYKTYSLHVRSLWLLSHGLVVLRVSYDVPVAQLFDPPLGVT